MIPATSTTNEPLDLIRIRITLFPSERRKSIETWTLLLVSLFLSGNMACSHSALLCRGQASFLCNYA
jgi:hypothetical protein